MGTKLSRPFIAAWLQPASNYSYLRTLGSTVVIGYEPGGPSPATRAQARASASALGLKYMFQDGSDSDLAYEAKDSACLGWIQKDEPDQNNDSMQRGSVLSAVYSRFKTFGPDKLVFVNFDGFNVLGRGKYQPYDYVEACKFADIICCDTHIVNRGYEMTVADGLKVYRENIQFLMQCGGPNKLYANYVEYSWQNLAKQGWTSSDPRLARFRRPTPDDISLEILNTMQLGCCGHVGFLHRIGAWFEDFIDVSIECVDRIRSVNKSLHLQELGAAAGDVSTAAASLQSRLNQLGYIS